MLPRLVLPLLPRLHPDAGKSIVSQDECNSAHHGTKKELSDDPRLSRCDEYDRTAVGVMLGWESKYVRFQVNPLLRRRTAAVALGVASKSGPMLVDVTE